MATEEYRAWIASINASNRARAQENGGPALIIDPETGREKMEGLRPGEMVWYDVNDGPRSQRGRRRFYGPNWHGPFPEYGIVDVVTTGLPRTPRECLEVLLDFKTGGHAADSTAPRRDDPGILPRLRAALHLKPHR